MLYRNIVISTQEKSSQEARQSYHNIVTIETRQSCHNLVNRRNGDTNESELAKQSPQEARQSCHNTVTQETRQSIVRYKFINLIKNKNMLAYFFEFAFLIGFIYGATKWGTFLLSDLITGFVLLLFFTNFHFQGHTRYKEEAIVFMVNLFFYAIVFVSSLFIYFDKENDKRMYYIFQIFVYFIFIIIDPLHFD